MLAALLLLLLLLPMLLLPAVRPGMLRACQGRLEVLLMPAAVRSTGGKCSAISCVHPHQQRQQQYEPFSAQWQLSILVAVIQYAQRHMSFDKLPAHVQQTWAHAQPATTSTFNVLVSDWRFLPW
jgi:hypothetical protein